MEVQRSGRVNIVLHLIGVLILKVLGWRVEGGPPNEPKMIVTVAPHTSYWDYPLCLFVSYYFRIKAAWFGKSEMFEWPLLGWFFPKTGGIPIYRDKHQGMVEQLVKAFNEREQMMLVLTPEGTRKKMPYWKSGFYRIAVEAKVPFCLGYLDFKRKVGGFGPLYYPTGDPEKDLEYFRNFYATIMARHPDRVGPICFKGEDTN